MNHRTWFEEMRSSTLEARLEEMRSNFMNATHSLIIHREFAGKNNDHPKVQERIKQLTSYFNIVIKSITTQESIPVGEIDDAIIPWLPANCIKILPESQQPTPLPLPKPKESRTENQSTKKRSARGSGRSNCGSVESQVKRPRGRH